MAETVYQMLDRHQQELSGAIAQVQDAAARSDMARDARSLQVTGVLSAIAEDVAARYGLTVGDLRGPSRFRDVAWPRQEAFAIARDRGFTLGQIGQHFGGRDHTTVKHGIKAHKAREAAR